MFYQSQKAKTDPWPGLKWAQQTPYSWFFLIIMLIFLYLRGASPTNKSPKRFVCFQILLRFHHLKKLQRNIIKSKHDIFILSIFYWTKCNHVLRNSSLVILDDICSGHSGWENTKIYQRASFLIYSCVWKQDSDLTFTGNVQWNYQTLC